MIWGDPERARAGSPRRSAPTRRSTSCCSSSTSPTRPRARVRGAVGGGARGARRRRASAAAPRRLASTLPDLLDDEASARARRARGRRSWRASARRCVCARALRSPRPATRPGCARSPRAAAGERAAAEPATAGSARPRRSVLLRGAGFSGARGPASPPDAEDAVAAGARDRLAGRAEALLARRSSTRARPARSRLA